MARGISYDYLLSETELENFKIYKRQIREIPRLTFEEEIELGKKMIHGDKKAREKLISSNLHIVIPLAEYYANPKISLPDLISEGNVGLTHAANIYSGKFKFSAFAYGWIKDSILTAISQTYSSIRPSFGLNEKLTKAKKYLEHYSFKEVAEIFHWTELQLAEFFGMRTVQSLDRGIKNKDGDCTPRVDTIPDNSQNVSEQFFHGLEREIIMYHLGEALDERELEIIKMRHGFYYELDYPLEDIGNFVGGISGERVRQIHDRAIEKIKKNPHLKKIIASGVTKYV